MSDVGGDDGTPASPSGAYIAFEDAQPPPIHTPTATPNPKQRLAQHASTPNWTGTSEVVRDLHRSLLEPTQIAIPTSASADATRLCADYRLHPDVGTASQLAQPGGFRRAHLLASDAVHSAASSSSMASGIDAAALADGAVDDSRSYRATPLLITLRRAGAMRDFITSAVQELGDGTEVIFQSRAYRRGARPRIVRAMSRELLVPREARRLRFIGFRPRSVPYWSTFTFLLGAFLFTQGSVDWFAVGAAPTPLWGVTIPYFVGACGFLVGCYLGFVEVINANLSEDLATGVLTPSGSIHRLGGVVVGRGVGGSCGGGGGGGGGGLFATSVRHPSAGESCVDFLRRLHWWRFQPRSLLWWGALVQLGGACLFQVACCAALPLSGVSGYASEAVWIYTPSLVGSIAFTFASYVYLLEAAADPDNPWKPPRVDGDAGWRDWLGYAVAMCNLFGSAMFSLASLCYFARDEAIGRGSGGESWAEWELLASLWGVRFCYGVGSLAFGVGAVLNFPEVMSDD